MNSGLQFALVLLRPWQLCHVGGSVFQDDELGPLGSGIGSSNTVDQGNKILSQIFRPIAPAKPMPSGLPTSSPILRIMTSDREIEILFRRLRLYDPTRAKGGRGRSHHPEDNEETLWA